MFIELRNLRMLPGEDTVEGMTSIAGVPHHVYFVRVQEDAEGVQVATNDPEGRLVDVQALTDDSLQTVRLPGHVGEFVCTIFPFTAE